MVASLEATPPKCATAPSRPPCPSTTRTRSQRLQQENVLISGHSCTPPENGLARMTYNASSRPCPYGRASGSTTRLLEPPANRALPGLMSSVRPRRRCSHILRYAPAQICRALFRYVVILQKRYQDAPRRQAYHAGPIHSPPADLKLAPRARQGYQPPRFDTPPHV
jgi:hypothetical protein